MGVKGMGPVYAPLRDRNRAHGLVRRGLALQEAGQVASAIASFQAAATLAPDHADAFAHLGAALEACGRASEAVAAWERHLALRPADARSYAGLGRALVAVGRAADALRVLTNGCSRFPDTPELLMLSGRALLRLGQPAAAMGSLILASPGLLHDPGLHGDLADAFGALGEMEAAAAHAAEAHRLAPSPEAATKAGAAALNAGLFGEGLAWANRALAAQPGAVDAHINRSLALEGLGRLAEAETAAWDAVGAGPDHAGAWCHLTTLRLSAGCWMPEVWEQFEWRLHFHGRPPWLGDARRWTSGPVRGQTVLLHAEQGLGDTLQFARYAAPVAALGVRVVLAVQPPLVRLLQTLPGAHEVVAVGGRLPRFSLFCPLGSLPGLFGTTVDTVPGQVPYLAAPAVPRGPGLRVGLAWAGNPGFAEDRQRSLSVRDLLPLRGLPGVELCGLQLGSGDVPALGMTDLLRDATDFADTAAQVAGLDLVVAADTAVAHLAGAMGKPVWLLSRHRGCWRWLRDRADSPWYPTMRIYRQATQGDWAGVIGRVRQDLAALAGSYSMKGARACVSGQ